MISSGKLGMGTSQLENRVLRQQRNTFPFNMNMKHHQRKTFQDEYREFLRKYRIEYDEEYVWD